MGQQGGQTDQQISQHHLHFDFRPYRRRFQPPLQTSHGLWQERRGIILRLQVAGTVNKQGLNRQNSEEQGLERQGSERQEPETQKTASLRAVGYGEIAPLPWFGTETFEEAIAFCQHCRPHCSSRSNTSTDSPWQPEALEALMRQLPSPPGSATAFALGSALGSAIAQLSAIAPPPSITVQPASTHADLPICALLPTGAAALERWPILWNQGYRTFKWKIGVADCQQEQDLLRQLRQQLPAAAQLRLDANGGLSLAQVQAWLDCCDALNDDALNDDATNGDNWGIEFLEQPLPPQEFSAMLDLAQRYNTPLALDESVATLTQLQDCHARGWRGIFVVKGAIAGPPQSVLDFCLHHDLDVVFSSVFETSIASNTVWAMAQQYAAARNPRHHDHHGHRHDHHNLSNTVQSSHTGQALRALGFGVSHWLEDDGLNRATAEQIWQRLSHSR